MCGIFGFSGDANVMNETKAKLVLNKVKILGLYNVDRGKHSCGIYINNQLIKGVDDSKMFSDFIAKKYLPNAMETGNFTIIGHTRQATTGEHTEANAHPFLVNDNLVLAHNGVIQNIWELCDKYGIDYTDINVDSHALAYLIEQEGFGILDKYRGYAALLITNKDTPNVLHFYRGVSKRYATAQNWEEERPLYYLQTKEGIYLSSIEKSLQAISDDYTDEVQIVPGSTVFTIENGKVSEQKRLPIDRSIVNWGLYNNTTTTTPKRAGVSKTTTTADTTPVVAITGTNGDSKNIDFDKVVPVIWHETLPARISRWKFNDGIIYHLGRFWIISNDVIKPANGEYYANSKGRIMPERRANKYFIDGVMMKNKKAYETAKVDANLANPNWNYPMYISKYSEYPVCASRTDVNTRCKEVPPHAKYRWYENETQMVTKAFTPVYSDRHYYIKDGLLDKITTQKNIEKEELINTKSLQAERKSVEDLRNSKSALVIVRRPPEEDYGISAIDKAIAESVKISEFLRSNKQGDLPFGDEPVAVFKGDDLDVTSFHRTFTSVDEALRTFSREEQRAIRYYIADIMNADGLVKVYNIYEDNVDLQFKMFLQMCVDDETTVIDHWNDKEFADIPTYLVTAKNNPDGSYSDFNANEELEEHEGCCVIPPKPEKKTTKVMGVQQGWFVMDSDLPEASDMQVSSSLGGIEVLEVEAIPTEEDEEEYGFRQQETYKPVPELAKALDDDQTEKELAFEETLDALLKAREEADAFQAMNDDFSQDMAHALYTGIDPILKKFGEITTKYNEKTSEKYLKTNVKLRVKS